MQTKRRDFMKACTLASAGFTIGASYAARAERSSTSVRRFNLSVSIDALAADPELLDIIRSAGITDVWLACFFQGHWHHSVEVVNEWRDRIRKSGMAVHNITIPLGHPAYNDTNPDYMPDVPLGAWRLGVQHDGRTHYGVSLHEPITQENVAALRQIKTTDPGIVFLDDDFRLATGPGQIGGCFCDLHRKRFLEKHGYKEAKWSELLNAAKTRTLTPILRDWIVDTCDELTASFRAQQKAAAPEAELGIMVMYLGAEKAGIRLEDYTGVPFRVGELMFNDKSFAPVKGKTNELFSALFHRRFTAPERAYSETTAWPADELSAQNMAAKLAITTISDVRNTMFMSGNTPFPRTHWNVLGPAIRKQAKLHETIAGHRPQGPFKHYWGEWSRWVSDDNPFSLFLAAGIPFEVTGQPPTGGWTFLSDHDAQAAEQNQLPLAGTVPVYRPKASVRLENGRTVEESIPDILKFKREILPQLSGIPYVVDDVPAVLAWYPSARAALLWNLTEQKQELTVSYGSTKRQVTLESLDSDLLQDLI